MTPRPTTPLRATYAALIVGCREQAGMSRGELAALAGVPPHVVGLWEDPRYEGVDLAILQRVARATGSELEIRFRPSTPSLPDRISPSVPKPAWKELLQGTKT